MYLEAVFIFVSCISIVAQAQIVWYSKFNAKELEFFEKFLKECIPSMKAITCYGQFEEKGHRKHVFIHRTETAHYRVSIVIDWSPARPLELLASEDVPQKLDSIFILKWNMTDISKSKKFGVFSEIWKFGKPVGVETEKIMHSGPKGVYPGESATCIEHKSSRCGDYYIDLYDVRDMSVNHKLRMYVGVIVSYKTLPPKIIKKIGVDQARMQKFAEQVLENNQIIKWDMSKLSKKEIKQKERSIKRLREVQIMATKYKKSCVNIFDIGQLYLEEEYFHNGQFQICILESIGFDTQLVENVLREEKKYTLVYFSNNDLNLKYLHSHCSPTTFITSSEAYREAELFSVKYLKRSVADSQMSAFLKLVFSISRNTPS